MWKSLTLILIYTITGGWCDKAWIKGVKYNDAKSWSLDRVPCEADRVIFPEETEIPIALPPYVKVREIVLPHKGALVLYTYGKVNITGRRESGSCPGQDVVFKSQSSGFWVDPSAWAPVDFTTIDLIELKSDGGEAVPHVERLPCTSDNVLFRQDVSFAVQLPPLPTTVRFVRMEKLPIWWRSYQDTELGSRQFLGEANNLKISDSSRTQRESCQNRGCDCGTEHLKEFVCSKVDPCEHPACFDPVQPIGFCCPICGSYFLYKDSPGFNYSVLRNRIQREVDEGVDWHLSRTGSYLQVVITDKGAYSARAPQAARSLNEILLSDPKLRITLHSIQKAGLVYSPLTAGRKVMNFLWTLFAVIIILSCLTIYFYRDETPGWRRMVDGGVRRGRVMFARFENLTGELEISPGVADYSPDQTVIRSFDNPMYERPPSMEFNLENPVYSEIKAKNELVEMSLVKDSDEAVGYG